MQIVYTYRYVPIWIQKRGTIPFRSNELPWQVLNSNIRSIETKWHTRKCMTKHEPLSGKTHAWNYDEKEPVYLKTHALDVGLGEGLLQVKDGINCLKDTAPDNAIWRSIVFSSKVYPVPRPTTAIWKGSTTHPTQSAEIPPLLLYQRNNHRAQTSKYQYIGNM